MGNNRTGPRIHLVWLVLFSAVAQGQQRSSHDNPFLSADVIDAGWPGIRGPDFDAVSAETHLADAWPLEGPPVLWVKDLGKGYSSFVVKDNRAYTQYQTLGGQYVICLDANTGETIWRHRYDWPFEPAGLYPGPRSTPTIADQRLYFATPSGAVGCLDSGGKPLWFENLKEEFDGKGTDFGYACSPTVVDGKVIMPVGGRGACMVALDAQTGSLIWKAGDGAASYTPAFPISVNGHRQVIGYLEHHLASFDLAKGTLLWQERLSKGYDEHSAWPVYREPYLWTSGPFQAGSQLLKLSGGNEAGFERVWQSPIMSNDVSSSVAVDGYLYGFDLAEAQTKAHRPSRGSFRCIDLLSGETRWSNGDAKLRRSTDFDTNREQQTIGHACVIAADGKLILFNDLGDLILARIDSERYIELARTPALQGEICWTSPALDRGRLFLRNHSRAICVYLGEPELLESSESGDILTISEIPQTAVHDFSSFLGVEPQYAMDPPTYRWLRNWFAVCMGILSAAALLTAAAYLCVQRVGPMQARHCFWSIALLAGLVTGTPSSILAGDFVFTWPLSLFITFQMAVYQSTIRRSNTLRSRPQEWQDRMIAIFFLAACLIYFVVCRRLSLVTEWVFLCGFALACPFISFGRWLSRREEPSLLAEFGVTLISFSAFFWSSAAILSVKYELSEF